MDALNEVFEGVGVVVGKSGLDMSDFNHVGGGDLGTRRDSIDNSYVFVSGANGDVPLDPVSCKEFDVIPNGVAGSHGIAENQDLVMKEEVDVVLVTGTNLEMDHDGWSGNVDAESSEVRTDSAPSVLDIGDLAIQVASTDSLEQNIRALTSGSEADAVSETSEVNILEENLGAGGSGELEGASSIFGKCADQTEMVDEAVSGESIVSLDKNDSWGVELKMNFESRKCKDLGRVALEFDDTRDEIMETMHENSERSDELPLDSPGVVLVASAESAQSEDLEGLVLGVTDSDSHKNLTRDTSIETSDELSLCQDSQVLISKVNAESGESKDLESLTPDSNNTSKDNKETTDKIAETSDVLSVGQDSRNMELEANRPSQGLNVSSNLKETGDEYKECAAKLEVYDKPIENQECVAMELKHDSESDVSRESNSLSLDVQKTIDENIESKDERCDTSDDQTEVQGAPNTNEANGYQLEETESEKLNLKEQKDFESFNHNRDEHESKVMVSEAPACQSEHENLESNDKRCEPSDDLTEVQEAPTNIEADGCQLEETESVKLNLEEQKDFESFNHNNDEHTSEVMVSEAPPCQLEDPTLCQNEFDLCAPQLNGIVQHHDEPCEQTDGSVNILFGSLRTETKMNNKPVKGNGSFSFGCEDFTTDHEVQNQDFTFSEATKFTDDVGICPVDDSLKKETKSKPVKNDEGFPSDCHDQDVTIELEIELQSPKLNSAECTDDGAVFSFEDTRSGNIESGFMTDNGVIGGLRMASCLANESGLEGTSDNGSKTLNIQDDDSHAKDVNLASKLKESYALGSRDVHINSDTMVAMVLESSNKEGASNLLSDTADVKSAGDNLNDAVKIKVNLISQDIGAADESQSSEVSADMTGSSTSATARQKFEEAMQRPFNFLVKLPRFDDEKLREQIRRAQIEVDEKTRHRDAFRFQIQNKRHNLHTFGVAYDAAGSEEIHARKLLKATRIKIESLQSLVGRMKNAISVEDIDARIYNIEHQMQHETMSLKEEKQSIREIKQLKQHREYLSANIGSQDEIQQALDQKDQNEDHLKVLKKELVELKEKVSKAQASATTMRKKYENENNLIQELQNQCRVANDVRQAAYENLWSLKKKLYEKHEHFRNYKNDVSAASDYAFSRNKFALNRLCVGQMETIMELWNNNEEFREEYVRCNLRSTVRRLGTIDGRSLGPNEEPPMVPSYTIVRADRSISNPNKKCLTSEAALEKKIEQKIATAAVAELKPVREILEPERFALENGLANSSGPDVSTSINGENLKVKETNDSTRKVEDSQNGVETSNLKEQDRLDEIAKAKEALEMKELDDIAKAKEALERKELDDIEKAKEVLERKKLDDIANAKEAMERKKLDDIANAKEAMERKKRIAEKAQIRAELRAQKEAEQRDKEREKRLRKKEKRRAGAGEASEGNTHSENEQSSEPGVGTVTEISESKEIPAAVARRPQKPSQFIKQSKSKPIPPPLRNRNRRKLQQRMYAVITSVLVIALFMLGNIGVFSEVWQHKSGF